MFFNSTSLWYSVIAVQTKTYDSLKISEYYMHKIKKKKQSYDSMVWPCAPLQSSESISGQAMGHS